METHGGFGERSGETDGSNPGTAPQADSTSIESLEASSLYTMPLVTERTAVVGLAAGRAVADPGGTAVSGDAATERLLERSIGNRFYG